MPMPDIYYVAKVVLFEMERVAPDQPNRNEKGELVFSLTHRGIPVAVGPSVESCLNAIDLRNSHWKNAQGMVFGKFDEERFAKNLINPDFDEKEPPFDQDCVHSSDGTVLKG